MASMGFDFVSSIRFNWDDDQINFTVYIMSGNLRGLPDTCTIDPCLEFNQFLMNGFANNMN